jgi:hypothetical protein
MEQNLQRRVVGLKDKLPDIQKTLDTVQFLKARRVMFPASNCSLTFCLGLEPLMNPCENSPKKIP